MGAGGDPSRSLKRKMSKTSHKFNTRKELRWVAKGKQKRKRAAEKEKKAMHQKV